MLISTPEELRAFLPTHVYRNLDTVRGFLTNSENTFLRQRIGQPLLTELNKQYAEVGPIVQTPIDAVGAAEDEAALAADPWITLITLCQRCIVYDAFYRSADIRALSDNDMGMNVAESDNFDAANDKRVDRYKAQLLKEAHAATDLLFIQLENWEQAIAADANDAQTTTADDATDDTNADESSLISQFTEIINLWKQSPNCYLCSGLLFNTATEFNQFVDIYDSRERFIQLMPDIRYCQELHIESEIGTDLLADLHKRHREGTLNAVEQRAYTMLQRCLSLYVEARAKMFSRPEARDEATGYMNLTLTYMRNHQTEFPYSSVKSSPIYDSSLWTIDPTTDQYIAASSSSQSQSQSQPSSQSASQQPSQYQSQPPSLTHDRCHPVHASMIAPPDPQYTYDNGRSSQCSHPGGNDSMLITSLI